MADQDAVPAGELEADLENLYHEETFTDLKAASIRRLTPVNGDGMRDESRPVMYIGETNLMTQMGPLPVQFSVEAESLADAFGQFPEGVRGAVERLNERAKEMAREEASRIVVPGAMPPGMGGPGGAGGMGGLPGPGGKIVI